MIKKAGENILLAFFMKEIWLAFPYKLDKQENKSFYLSFLIRSFLIKWQDKYKDRIEKKEFYKVFRDLWWNKWRITKTWNYAVVWTFFNYINKDYLILRWKEKIVGTNWFITKVSNINDISYYKFFNFVTETYALRPVKQLENIKYKKKSTKYNEELFKRSLNDKKSRWLRKIAEQSWCCLKTAQKRLKKSKDIKILKRYDNYNWFKIRKTNLYFSNKDKVFLRYYSQNYNTKTSKTTLNSDHSSLINKKALFLNWCLSLNNSDDYIYNNINLLDIS